MDELQRRVLTKCGPLEKEMATHSRIFDGEFHGQRNVPGGLQSMGSQKFGHD